MDTKERLESLLVENYQHMKQNGGNTSPQKTSYIQGFMEACLLNRSVTRNMIEATINKAHTDVFGVDYESRQDLKQMTDDWLDIPTHVRKQKEILIDN